MASEDTSKKNGEADSFRNLEGFEFHHSETFKPCSELNYPSQSYDNALYEYTHYKGGKASASYDLSGSSKHSGDKNKSSKLEKCFLFLLILACIGITIGLVVYFVVYQKQEEKAPEQATIVKVSSVKSSLTLDIQWDSQLEDKTSEEYSLTKSAIESELDETFKGTVQNYKSVTVIDFRQGSVVVFYVLEFVKPVSLAVKDVDKILEKAVDEIIKSDPSSVLSKTVSVGGVEPPVVIPTTTSKTTTVATTTTAKTTKTTTGRITTTTQTTTTKPSLCSNIDYIINITNKWCKYSHVYQQENDWGLETQCIIFWDTLTCFIYNYLYKEKQDSKLCPVTQLITTVKQGAAAWEKAYSFNIQKCIGDEVTLPTKSPMDIGNICSDINPIYYLTQYGCSEEIEAYVQAARRMKCFFVRRIKICVVRVVNEWVTDPCDRVRLEQFLVDNQDSLFHADDHVDMKSCDFPITTTTTTPSVNRTTAMATTTAKPPYKPCTDITYITANIKSACMYSAEPMKWFFLGREIQCLVMKDTLTCLAYYTLNTGQPCSTDDLILTVTQQTKTFKSQLGFNPDGCFDSTGMVLPTRAPVSVVNMCEDINVIYYISTYNCGDPKEKLKNEIDPGKRCQLAGELKSCVVREMNIVTANNCDKQKLDSLLLTHQDSIFYGEINLKDACQATSSTARTTSTPPYNGTTPSYSTTKPPQKPCTDITFITSNIKTTCPYSAEPMKWFFLGRDAQCHIMKDTLICLVYFALSKKLPCSIYDLISTVKQENKTFETALQFNPVGCFGPNEITLPTRSPLEIDDYCDDLNIIYYIATYQCSEPKERYKKETDHNKKCLIVSEIKTCILNKVSSLSPWGCNNNTLYPLLIKHQQSLFYGEVDIGACEVAYSICSDVYTVKVSLGYHCQPLVRNIMYAEETQKCSMYKELVKCVMLYMMEIKYHMCKTEEIVKVMEEDMTDLIDKIPGFDSSQCWGDKDPSVDFIVPLDTKLPICSNPNIINVQLQGACTLKPIQNYSNTDDKVCQTYWMMSGCTEQTLIEYWGGRQDCFHDNILTVVANYSTKMVSTKLSSLNVTKCNAELKKLGATKEEKCEAYMFTNFSITTLCAISTMYASIIPAWQKKELLCVLGIEAMECMQRLTKTAGLDCFHSNMVNITRDWLSGSMSYIAKSPYYVDQWKKLIPDIGTSLVTSIDLNTCLSGYVPEQVGFCDDKRGLIALSGMCFVQLLIPNKLIGVCRYIKDTTVCVNVGCNNTALLDAYKDQHQLIDQLVPGVNVSSCYKATCLTMDMASLQSEGQKCAMPVFGTLMSDTCGSVGEILTCLASYIKKELGVDCSYAEKQILWERFKDDFVNGLAAFGLSLNVDSCQCYELTTCPPTTTPAPTCLAVDFATLQSEGQKCALPVFGTLMTDTCGSVGKIVTCLTDYIKRELGVECSYAEKEILWEQFKTPFVMFMTSIGMAVNVDSCQCYELTTCPPTTTPAPTCLTVDSSTLMSEGQKCAFSVFGTLTTDTCGSVGKILTCLAAYIKRELGVECSYAEKQILWNQFKDHFIAFLAEIGMKLDVDSCTCKELTTCARRR